MPTESLESDSDLALMIVIVALVSLGISGGLVWCSCFLNLRLDGLFGQGPQAEQPQNTDDGINLRPLIQAGRLQDPEAQQRLGESLLDQENSLASGSAGEVGSGAWHGQDADSDRSSVGVDGGQDNRVNDGNMKDSQSLALQGQKPDDESRSSVSGSGLLFHGWGRTSPGGEASSESGNEEMGLPPGF